MSQKRLGIYTIGPEIGKGSFATVYKCVDNRTHQFVAIKSVVRSKLKLKKLLENLEIEISILKTMKHPHIVGLLDCTQTTTHFHLAMDYCSMGDLLYFIRKRDQLTKTHPVIMSLLERYPSPEGSHGLNQTLVVHFLKQLASALEFLRSKSLVHRDIKPQNLLLSPPVHSKADFETANYVGLWELPILKIADFGFARFLPLTSMAETLCGSPLYMAPEILRYEKYNAKADLWSVGAVLYEMAVGKPPFKADNHVQLLKNIERSNDRIKFPSVSQVQEPLKRLIRLLLKCNPTERISFGEFFKDDLISTELRSNDKPLERSVMDENLFISEYISPIKDRSVGKPEREEAMQREAIIRDPETQKTRIGSSNPEKAGSPSSQSYLAPIKVPRSASSSARDEQIKNIINKNSPGPDSLVNSIQTIAKSGDLAATTTETSSSNARNDIILEKDYVVVEKRAVEVNAIADELAHAGSGAVAINPPERNEGSTNLGFRTGYRRGSMRENSVNQERRPSFAERRISILISPTNALSKAIGLASNRLFGAGQIGGPTSPSSKGNVVVGTDPTYEISGFNGSYSTVMSSPNFVDKLLLQKINLPISHTIATSPALEDEDKNLQLVVQQPQSPTTFSDEWVLSKLESIATKGHAINLFADVKFSQLIPSPPSSEGVEDDTSLNVDTLPPKIVKVISEEGVVLYVKTLSILAQGMAIASNWWFDKSDGSEHSIEQNLTLSIRINELVQWIRERFNESLEKAEFVRLRLQEANDSLRKEEEDEISSFIVDKNQVVAEKLIFDRALEISRNAAVNELVKEDLKGCELAYSTAIWMLEALLDDDGPKEEEKLDKEDKAMVEKFIVSIGNRLSVLKKKLELTPEA